MAVNTAVTLPRIHITVLCAANRETSSGQTHTMCMTGTGDGRRLPANDKEVARAKLAMTVRRVHVICY